jgi:hypothetical protein
MASLHSHSKEQREAVRQLVQAVLTRDMSTFTADAFKHWIKDSDAKFRKVGLTLKFDIRERVVYFTVKEVRSGRAIYHFDSSTRVPFESRDVIMSLEAVAPVWH